MQQYFVSKVNDNFILKNEDLYHLVTVLRAKEKRKIICIFDDKRFICEFSGNIENYEIEIISEINSDIELEKDIILYQALIRNENFDLVLQKATELGVRAIAPTIFKRNVVKIEKNKEESKLTRFQTICKNASEQSHRMVIPDVLNITSLKDITLEENELGLICYENENKDSIFDIKDLIKEKDTIKVVIGPEGGITNDEYELLLNKGFKSVTLGKRILRSETASFNILSVLGYLIEIEK